MTEQVAGWTLGTREVISWKSRDGTEIEVENGLITAWRDYFCVRQFAEGTGLAL